MTIGYRVRIDKIFEMLRAFRHAPRPGWRVLLTPGGLSSWMRWAEKFEERVARTPKDATMEISMREPWLFKSWNDFETFHAGMS